MGLSRGLAYQHHGISTSYLFKIEAGLTTPKPETLDKIINGYGLDPMRGRHLHELSNPTEPIPTADRLRRCAHGTVGRSYLRDLEGRDICAAYVDPLWNVLDSTDGFRSLLAGVDETGNMRAWMFGPRAHTVLTDWPYEATRTVAVVRAALGRYRTSEQARDLIRQLRPNNDFRRLWSESTRVAYGRHITDLLHRRDPETKELTSWRISVADLTQNSHIQLVTAIRQHYSGPDPANT
ncbi:MmyB family transcriptional regulator [Nocardia callitridis]|uniref:MmyB family transcriptional regulator n=1 Tax=Nocardia callitridis TaxID=648753 RepID=UPI0031E709A8